MSKPALASERLLLLLGLLGSVAGCLETERVCVVRQLCGTNVSAQQAYEACDKALREGTDDAKLLRVCKLRAEECAKGEAPPEWCGPSAATDAATPDADGSMRPDGAVGSACPPCTSPERCHEQLGQCVQCLSTSDCDGDLRCNEGSGECVQCLGNTDCGPQAPVCSDGLCTGCTRNAECGRFIVNSVCASAGECVQCASDADCPDPSASKCSASNTCVPCDDSAQCAHQPDLPVCVTGTCKACDGTHYEACGLDTGNTDKPFVCDSLNNVCSDQVEGSSGLCGPCVSDAHCPAGQLCVLQSFDDSDVGYFCMWERAAGVGGAPESCTTAQPYFKALTGVSSIDNATGDLCTLRVSTCPAITGLGSPAVQCAQGGIPDDALCGAPNVEDGFCRALAPPEDDTYRCTVPCVSDDDCPSGVTCNTLVLPRVCSL
jgi:hypothetical protein